MATSSRLKPKIPSQLTSSQKVIRGINYTGQRPKKAATPTLVLLIATSSLRLQATPAATISVPSTFRSAEAIVFSSIQVTALPTRSQSSLSKILSAILTKLKWLAPSQPHLVTPEVPAAPAHPAISLLAPDPPAAPIPILVLIRTTGHQLVPHLPTILITVYPMLILDIATLIPQLAPITKPLLRPHLILIPIQPAHIKLSPVSNSTLTN